MPSDLDLLQGTWSIRSLRMDGHEMPSAIYANAGIVVKGDRFTSTGMGAEYEGTLELDASTNPRQLNMRFDAGPEKGNVNLCIYEIAGNDWKLCVATRGPVRPSSFDTTPGSGIAVEVLKRNNPRG
jgi:uncharacterized protein (TIGR03067 family)